MFLSRRRRGRDRFVRIKLACLVAGGVLGLVGMQRDSVVLIDIAITVVLAGFALRFVPDRAPDDHVPDADIETAAPEAEQPAPDP